LRAADRVDSLSHREGREEREEKRQSKKAREEIERIAEMVVDAMLKVHRVMSRLLAFLGALRALGGESLFTPSALGDTKRDGLPHRGGLRNCDRNENELSSDSISHREGREEREGKR
jgi:hypothetical protein